MFAGRLFKGGGEAGSLQQLRTKQGGKKLGRSGTAAPPQPPGPGRTGDPLAPCPGPPSLLPLQLAL